MTPHFPLPPASGSHHSIFCFHDFECFGYLTKVKSHSICPLWLSRYHPVTLSCALFIMWLSHRGRDERRELCFPTMFNTDWVIFLL